MPSELGCSACGLMNQVAHAERDEVLKSLLIATQSVITSDKTEITTEGITAGVMCYAAGI